MSEIDMNKINMERFAEIVINDRKEISYRHHQAIEYAREKLGIKWDSNRQRLSFYEYFDEYDKAHGGIGL